MQVSNRRLADEIVNGMREKLPDNLERDARELWAVCVCGSYVRGDFMEANSDLDFHLYLVPGARAAVDPYRSEAFLAVRELTETILAGRGFVCHNPGKFDWIVSPWESVPKTQSEIVVRGSAPALPYFNVFLFDYVANVQSLWGHDPLSVLPAPLPFTAVAASWFEATRETHARYEGAGESWRIAFRAFKSIQVAQALFGEETLDKRRLLELYTRHVPEFEGKEFGAQIIREKLEQRYPDKPCVFLSPDRYAAFETQLAEVALDHLNS